MFIYDLSKLKSPYLERKKLEEFNKSKQDIVELKHIFQK